MIYLNGEWMSADEGKVSVWDRGFLFGDGIYEVIPVYRRIPFRLGDHVRRLSSNLATLRIDPPMDEAKWRALIVELISRQPFENQAVYLQVTRGVARPRRHRFPDKATPTVFLMADEIDPDIGAQYRADGVEMVVIPDRRWLESHIKSVSLLGNVLAAQAAADAGVYEVLLHRDGIVSEAAASNVMMVKDGALMTPVFDHRILPGVTATVALELAREAGIPVVERDIRLDEFRGADEVLVCSSTKDVLPVVRLDGQPIADARPGPVFARLNEAFQPLKSRPDPA